nr:hypothetical protein [Streptomyces antimycoticus]
MAEAVAERGAHTLVAGRPRRGPRRGRRRASRLGSTIRRPAARTRR